VKNVRLVLLRPRVPENLGAIARAMRNLGFSQWALVEPRTLDFEKARRVAVHAEELLDRPWLCATLDEAVADCVWVVGTSSRKVKGKRSLSPQEVAREAQGRGPVALIFGDERSGLSNAEIERCHDLSAIPAEPAQPSLNLAQAVLVYLWELRRAGEGVGEEGKASPADPTATDRELEVLQAALRAALRAGGFLRGPERHAVKDLFATLRRSRISRREAQLWIAALKGLAKR
jgi:tRNA/rRNA methyltransferase